MPRRIYNQQALFGPLYAFLVVISPPENIRKEIALMKQLLNDMASIGYDNLNSIGHITITDKLTDDANLADMVASLIKGVNPFTINLNGFGIFDHGSDKKTIYLNIEDYTPVIEIMEAVKAKAKFPHLSIAKKFLPGRWKLLSRILKK